MNNFLFKNDQFLDILRVFLKSKKLTFKIIFNINFIFFEIICNTVWKRAERTCLHVLAPSITFLLYYCLYYCFAKKNEPFIHCLEILFCTNNTSRVGRGSYIEPWLFCRDPSCDKFHLILLSFSSFFLFKFYSHTNVLNAFMYLFCPCGVWRI